MPIFFVLEVRGSIFMRIETNYARWNTSGAEWIVSPKRRIGF